MLLSWGANSYGQLGHGRKCEEVRSPTHVKLESDDSILSKISNIEVGANQSFLLLNDGTVYGCGLSNVGQLGDTNPDKYTFVKLSSLSAYKIIQLSCKWDVCHAITSDGLCIGWGANTFGQLGLNPNQIKQTKEPIVLCNSAVQVAAGLRHSAVLLQNGKVKTAGMCRRGQLGRKFFEEEYKYDDVEDLENVAKIACGQNFTLALTTDGKLYGWGCNKFGQLGITPARCQFSDIPLSIELVSPLLEEIRLNDFLELKCGWTHCILQVGKKLFSWGRNNYGQLGISAHNVPYSHTMVEVLTVENVKSVAVGAEHNLLITVDIDRLESLSEGTIRQAVKTAETLRTRDLDLLSHLHLAASIKLQSDEGTQPYNLLSMAFGMTGLFAPLCLAATAFGSENGMLKTWGWNEHGSCGDGSNNCAIFQPVVINTPPKAKVIGAGSAHSFCLFQ